MSEPIMKNISDTAVWVATYRAEETERPDAVFKDPFARSLAGERGREIVKQLRDGAPDHSWALISRTYALDALITEQVAKGVDLVLNLAAGLDTRPYRMNLPKDLRWVEVDLPGIFDYKEKVMGDAKPVCTFERVRLDLSDKPKRRELFKRVGHEGKKILVITEGLLIYLPRNEVEELAQDLAAVPTFQRWIMDLASPGLMKMMLKQFGDKLDAANAPFKFAPEEGPGFFAAFGWNPVKVRSNLKTGAEIKRLSFWLKVAALFPDSTGRQGSRPWAGNCLFEKA